MSALFLRNNVALLQHRRLDIIAVPYNEYATSLIYFTGSAHFTRSIYAKAKSMGHFLNHHGLCLGVVRQVVFFEMRSQQPFVFAGR